MKKTTNQFIEDSIKVHGNKYDYSLVDYKRSNKKIKVKCVKHGIFKMTPNNHLRKRGCPKCKFELIGNIKRYTVEEFTEKAKQVHHNKYNYSLVRYNGWDNKVKIICPVHGEFLQTVREHLNKCGCQKCGIKSSSSSKLLSTEKFINKAIIVHKNLYDYSKSIYNRSQDKIEIVCSKHGSFFQQAASHLSGYGCPKCHKIISKQEEEFLSYLQIPHTKENRQVCISRKRIDGYDKNTNTLYEFLGDYFHGNPEIYNFNDYNQVCHKKFGLLYKDTFKKLKKLKKLGYNIKYIWESDWKRFKDGIINHPNIQVL